MKLSERLKKITTKEFDLLAPFKKGLYNLNLVLVKIELNSLNQILQGNYDAKRIPLAIQSAKRAREYFAIVKYNGAEEIKKELSDKLEKVKMMSPFYN